MHPTVLFLALVAPLAADAWSIMFYSGENCNNDPSFDNVEYSGNTQMSDCLIAGEPGQADKDHCVWHTDNGATSAPCTGPMASPKSWMFGTNGEDEAHCWVSWSNQCPGGWFKGTEPVVGQCYSTSDKVIDKPNGVAPIVFWCNDSHQD